MDINLLRILSTVASFAAFIGIAAWAYGRRNRAAFDEAAQIPFSGAEHEHG